MKKFKGLLSALALVLVIGIFAQSAYAAETVTVTEVDDITSVMSVSPIVYEVGTGEYSHTVQFHLDKPAYVYVAGYSNVCAENVNNLGNIESFAVYTDATCKNVVYGDKISAIWAEGTNYKYLCLDAGDYWINFAKEDSIEEEEWNALSYGEFALTIAAQYVDATGTQNGSKAKAQAVPTNKMVTGFLSSNTRNSWFTFEVTGDDTVVNIGASLENVFGEDKFPVQPTGISVYSSKNKLLASFNINNYYYDTAVCDTMTLAKGTYYIQVSGDSAYYDGWDGIKLSANEGSNMGQVNLYVTTVEKPVISSWKNTAASKAKVVYKKVADAEGYEIQYSTDKDFSSGVKTKKVKGTKAKAVIGKLTKGNTYYVRVRTWKYDALDEKVYSNWSTVKSVKITK